MPSWESRHTTILEPRNGVTKAGSAQGHSWASRKHKAQLLQLRTQCHRMVTSRPCAQPEAVPREMLERRMTAQSSGKPPKSNIPGTPGTGRNLCPAGKANGHPLIPRGCPGHRVGRLLHLRLDSWHQQCQWPPAGVGGGTDSPLKSHTLVLRVPSFSPSLM